MSAPDGIESIIRRIVREEVERAAEAAPTRPAVDDRKLLYSVTDVAAVTGMSAQYVRNDIRSGQLAASQPSGSKYLVDREIAVRYAAWLRAGRPGVVGGPPPATVSGWPGDVGTGGPGRQSTAFQASSPPEGGERSV